MPLQFVAQGPMLIPAVGGGNVATLGTVPSSDWAEINFTDPCDFTGTVPAGGTNPALVVWVMNQNNVEPTVTWDPSGANEALSLIVKFDSAQSLYGFAKLNPTPGTAKTIRVSNTGNTRYECIAQTFQNVLQTSVAAAFTGGKTGFDVADTHPNDTVTTTAGDIAIMFANKTTAVAQSNPPFVADHAFISQGINTNDIWMGVDYNAATTASTAVGLTHSGSAGVALWIAFNIEKA